MNINAKNAFALPHRSKSGARKNSSVFIVAMIMICTIALTLVQILVKIQMAIAISESPIKTVSIRACSFPKILATISWCLGTRFSTLHKRPFASQTAAIRKFKN